MNEALNEERECVLEVNDLHLAIRGMEILKGLTFDIHAGETVGVIGPNGSGKTTLFNSISGFLPLTKGSITFRGEDITSLKPNKRAKKGLGRVFQNFGIFRDMTVQENIVTALEGRQPLIDNLLPWGNSTAHNKEKALEYLREVSLEEKAMDRANSLSGGQMRLLEIIRTRAFGAELFLLDEPTAGVSPKMKKDVAELIAKLQALGKTIMIIEHDINFIQKFCTRIIVLESGKMVLDGTPEYVREHELLQEIYFGKH